MNTSKLFPALLTCAVALCAHPAHAAKLDYDGLSAEEALSLGLNDSDRDTNDAGVIDGLEFDKTAILSVNIRNPFPSSGESKRPSITFDGKQVFYRRHLFSRALIHTRLIFQAAAAYKWQAR